MLPEDREYTFEHQWIKTQGQKARVGLTHYAQESLGEIIFIELPENGQVIHLGDMYGMVESLKALSDLYSPCTGIVLSVNEDVLDRPELLNEDPYGLGWLIEIKLEQKPLDLLSPPDYQAYMSSIK